MNSVPERGNGLLFLAASMLVVLFVQAASADAGSPPTPFEATFDLYRNDKLIGESTITMELEGDRWLIRTSSKGTRGVARFLGVKESSQSRGAWDENGPRPERFEQSYEVAIKTIRVSADFDWDAGVVTSVWDDGRTTLELEPGVVDPTSVTLALRAGLAAGESEWRLPMVDEDEIEEQHFRAEAPARRDTGLGCLRTREVKKIRAPESTRFTNTFYAVDLAYVPVRLEHGKTDGDRMESRIRSLRLEGAPVTARPPCAADSEADGDGASGSGGGR